MARFDEMFNDSLQLDEIKKQMLRRFLEKYRAEFDECKLVYRASEHGFKASDFHKYCDNKGATISIISNTENRFFGGFTKLSWARGILDFY